MVKLQINWNGNLHWMREGDCFYYCLVLMKNKSFYASGIGYLHNCHTKAEYNKFMKLKVLW